MCIDRKHTKKCIEGSSFPVDSEEKLTLTVTKKKLKLTSNSGLLLDMALETTLSVHPNIFLGRIPQAATGKGFHGWVKQI